MILGGFVIVASMAYAVINLVVTTINAIGGTDTMNQILSEAIRQIIIAVVGFVVGMGLIVVGFFIRLFSGLIPF
jgi:hypothetical protein